MKIINITKHTLIHTASVKCDTLDTGQIIETGNNIEHVGTEIINLHKLRRKFKIRKQIYIKERKCNVHYGNRKQQSGCWFYLEKVLRPI